MKKLLALSVFITFHAIAQQPLSLQTAIGIALKNSLNIQIGKNVVAVTNINNDYAIAGALPIVSLNATDVQQSTSVNQKLNNGTQIKGYGAPSNNLNFGLNATVPVYNGGKINTAKKRLEEVHSQSEQQLNSRIQLVVANVMLKYFDIIRQQSYAATLQRSIDASKQKLEIIKTQQSVGLANNADLFQSQVDYNAQLQALQAQQLVIDLDKTDLLTLLTLKSDSTVIISDTIEVDRNIALDSILNNLYINPDVIAAEHQIKINEFIERETAALRYPALNFNTGANYSRNQSGLGNFLLNQGYGPFVGFSLAIPIYNGGIYKKQQQIAGINLKTSQLQKDTLLVNYTANTVKNWQAYKSNLQQLETAKQNNDLSQKLLDLVLQRFQLKQATIVDVKNAQQSFESAGYLLVNLSYAAKAAEIQLKRYANKLSY